MLHILLLILKIIGIILAVILGILLLLVGIILFVPIRYEVSAKCDGTIDTLKAKIKATWLLHFVRADVLLKGKKLKWKVRFAWFKRSNQMNTDKTGETNRKEEYEPEKVEETAIEDKESEKTSEVIEEKCEEHSEDHRANQLGKTVEINDERSDTTKETGEATSEKCKKESVGDRVKKLIEKIRASIQKICEQVKGLMQKKEKVTDFLTDEVHIRAFHKVKNWLFILLKRIKPKKINIKLRFGFEDPGTTGRVLGVFGMLYPFLGDTTEIIPDFENQVLKGTVYLKGRIRFSRFAALALKLLLCKDVRTSYKDIRNFKL